MVKERHESTRRSQHQCPVPEVWTQAGRGVQRGGGEVRAGKREGHYLSQQRSGARNPQSFQQSFAHSSGAVEPAGRVYGKKSLQIASLVCVLLLLAGCAAHREPPPVMPAPPPSPHSIPPARIPTPTPTPVPTPTPRPRAPAAKPENGG